MPSPETHLGSNAATYATDFYAWCLDTAALVREAHWSAIDLEALAEELEDLGKNLTRELESRLDVLVMHLLKWAYQAPQRATGHSWYSTIREQRRQLARLLRDNPSLRRQLPTLLPTIYQEARSLFQQDPQQVDLSHLLRWSTLPPACPWTADEVLADDFWPAASVDEEGKHGA
jgi:hypothetical protein